MQHRPWLALALLLGLGTFLVPATASAYLYIYGEAAVETGDLPDALANIDDFKGMRAGYKCDMFSILWAYIYLDDCSPVIYREMGSLEFEYVDDSAFPGLKDVLEEEYSEDDMKINAWQNHGKWVLGLVILLFIGSKFMGGSDDEDEEVDLSALNDSISSDDAGGGDDGGAASFNDADTIIEDDGGGDDDDGDDGPLG